MIPLGQVAYEAYCDSVGWHSVHGDVLPAYADQSPTIRSAWEAAAQAVASVLLGEER